MIRKLYENLVLFFYSRAAVRFGISVSFLPMGGECHGFRRHFRSWKFWERLYMRAGFLPLPVEVLTILGDSPSDGDVEVWAKMFLGLCPADKPHIKACLHAPIYERAYLGKAETLFIDHTKTSEGGLSVTYTPPTTGDKI